MDSMRENSLLHEKKKTNVQCYILWLVTDIFLFVLVCFPCSDLASQSFMGI